jgi:hypothetical protein
MRRDIDSVNCKNKPTIDGEPKANCPMLRAIRGPLGVFSTAGNTKRSQIPRVNVEVFLDGSDLPSDGLPDITWRKAQTPCHTMYRAKKIYSNVQQYA